ncbi:protein YdhJ [Enterobacter asburiae]|uniref:Protein YdhJ n=1 Tax=Enterobacter asburiae TaxID=61645 RepID=A0A376F745_ENTAS|nr:protein YdhJ [Enterobacter asburiae]
MTFFHRSEGLPLQDLIFGASVYFPPLFKAVLVGFYPLAHRASSASRLDVLRRNLASHADGSFPFCPFRMPGPCRFDCVVNMSLKTLKYFSTLFVLALALVAGWWMWNFLYAVALDA